MGHKIRNGSRKWLVNLYLLFKYYYIISLIICVRVVSQSLSNIRAANNTLNNIENMSLKYNEKFQQWNNSMGTRLQELRDKIAKAKHAAEGVSLFSD